MSGLRSFCGLPCCSAAVFGSGVAGPMWMVVVDDDRMTMPSTGFDMGMAAWKVVMTVLDSALRFPRPEADCKAQPSERQAGKSQQVL